MHCPENVHVVDDPLAGEGTSQKLHNWLHYQKNSSCETSLNANDPVLVLVGQTDLFLGCPYNINKHTKLKTLVVGPKGFKVPVMKAVKSTYNVVLMSSTVYTNSLGGT